MFALVLLGNMENHETDECRREGKFMEVGASLYVGDWVRGVRQGYGVQVTDVLSWTI